MTDSRARNFGKYELVKEVGRGGMGTVYLGHDPFADRQVAIKVAHLDALVDEASGNRYRKLFYNEAKITSMLRHPNIVEVYDAGFDEDQWFIVMEYMPRAYAARTHRP